MKRAMCWVQELWPNWSEARENEGVDGSQGREAQPGLEQGSWYPTAVAKPMWKRSVSDLQQRWAQEFGSINDVERSELVNMFQASLPRSEGKILNAHTSLQTYNRDDIKYTSTWGPENTL